MACPSAVTRPPAAFQASRLVLEDRRWHTHHALVEPDWANADLIFLRNQILRGNVVLFAGAGFSLDGRNRGGEAPPLGRGLAERLAGLASLRYNGEPLPIVLEAAERKVGAAALWKTLRDLYEVTAFDDWYRLVPTFVWSRIYTTNIDNFFDRLYLSHAAQRLRTIVCPAEPEERDQLLDELQCIHLHGHVGYSNIRPTFTFEDFARQSVRPNPWYQSLAEDLFFHPVLFVGTALEDPPFYHYLQLREARPEGAPRVGPKSFLVSPSVGQIRETTLATRNIHCIECDASTFFTSLGEVVPASERNLDAVRKRVFPHLEFRQSHRDADTSLNRYFDHIIADQLPASPPHSPGLFFMGAEPTWSDVREGLDAARDINTVVASTIREAARAFKCIVLHGPAGSGKSTTLMRVSATLASEGHAVYFARNESRSDFSGLLRVAEAMADTGSRFIAVVDGFSRHLPAITESRNALLNCPNLTLVLADRSNSYFSRAAAVAALQPVEVEMPDLSEADINRILDQLDTHDFLGALKGKDRKQQVAAFMTRADKQLLVAMREATSGRGFDAILRGEFTSLSSEARLAYVICCLAVSHGAPGVYRRHLLPALGSTTMAKTVLLEQSLRNVLISANQSGSMLRPRHKLIGTWVAREIADEDVKYEATRCFLTQVSADIIPTEIRRRSPAFLAYRGMINCDGLWEGFSGDSKVILGLYEELRPYYAQDYLFWLQYGMAHIKAGHLDLAENYLNQSLAIRPQGNFQTRHHMGILFLLQAMESPRPGAAIDRAKEGIALLREQILVRGDEDAYPYAAYLTHVARWYDRARELSSDKEWEELRNIEKEARNKYPREEVVKEASKEVGRLYMMRAVKSR